MQVAFGIDRWSAMTAPTVRPDCSQSSVVDRLERRRRAPAWMLPTISVTSPQWSISYPAGGVMPTSLPTPDTSIGQLERKKAKTLRGGADEG